MMRYEMFARRTLMSGKQWFWRLRADNNRKIAVSGEGYQNKQDCRHAIDLVQGAAEVRIVEVEK